MSCNVLLAFSAYAFVTSITPGPSNLMLLASGASFGFARTVPPMLGITAGFGALLLGIGLGLGAVLAAFPALHVGPEPTSTLVANSRGLDRWGGSAVPWRRRVPGGGAQC